VGFRSLLLNKCQQEFEKDKVEELDIAERQKLIDEATSVSSYTLHSALGLDCDTMLLADTGTRRPQQMYVTYVAHSVRTFKNTTSLTLCFETYVRCAYTMSCW